jgi:hypothetical protein
VKKPTIALLSTVFVALIACSIQSVTADHHLSGNSIFKDLTHVNIADQKDSEYHIYLQVEVRNAQGQLISISEDSIGRIIPHELTDHVFNENLGKIEIITVDNIKYEKVQYTDYMQAEELLINSQTSHFIGLWRIIMCGEVVGHGHPCLPVFQVNTSHVFITKGDAVTLHWTVLRIIN